MKTDRRRNMSAIHDRRIHAGQQKEYPAHAMNITPKRSQPHSPVISLRGKSNAEFFKQQQNSLRAMSYIVSKQKTMQQIAELPACPGAAQHLFLHTTGGECSKRGRSPYSACLQQSQNIMHQRHLRAQSGHQALRQLCLPLY